MEVVRLGEKSRTSAKRKTSFSEWSHKWVKIEREKEESGGMGWRGRTLNYPMFEKIPGRSCAGSENS